MRVHIGVRTAPSVRSGGLERATADTSTPWRRQAWACARTCRTTTCRTARRSGCRGRAGHSPGRPTFGAAYLVWMARLAASIDRCWADGDVLLLHGASSGALTRLHVAPPSAAVVNPHGMEEFGPRSLLREVNLAPLRHAARRGAALAHGLVATDERLVAEMQRNFPQCRRTLLIPNAIDVARLDDLAARGSRTRPRQARCCRSAGWYPTRATTCWPRAAEVASGDDPVTWVHLGAGPEIHKINRIAGSNDHLRLIHRDDASDAEAQAAMACCRLFVQPSRYEGSSLTVLEAMARGAVVVATPVGGIPDKIVDGRTGFLATAATVPALGRAVRRATAGASDEMRWQARQLVERRFGLGAQAEAYRSLFRDVVSGVDHAGA